MRLFYSLLSASVEEELPFWKELWQYFYDTYLNPSEYYPNLDFGSGTMLSVRLIIFGLCVGMALAGFGAVFNKRVLGDVVRKILAAEALSPESAKTLEELGYENNAFVRLAVKKSTSLRRVVKCCEEQLFDAEQNEKYKEYLRLKEQDKKTPRFRHVEYKINPYADAFYIPEQMKYMADIKFEKKGNSWLGAVIFAVIMVIVFVLMMIALPHVLGLLDSFVGTFDSAPSNILT